ncbi:hypothetical protein JTE90_023783 [Oedothorax gibbosus]|uniref:Uncharacterized protein n=1 Tax=Oedothorax gibbosus TaxID=931172 RepID=A0AAV6UTL2_9ARAC|nr:hypothetical protein JTE90_023783 [Oedothorax gibbosus]
MAKHRYLPWGLAFIILFLILHSVLAATEEPEFTRPQYNVTIPENSIPKTQAISSEKMGIFVSDPTLLIKYKIVAGDTDRFFKAETRLVGDFWFLIIRVRTGNRAVLNREYQDTYRLQVRATITSDLRRALKMKAQTEVIVKVTDTNDLPPQFYPPTYEVSVPEDQPLHTSILQISAHDPDFGINGEIYYNLEEPSLQFAVHPTRGILTLTRFLDYQKQPVHKFVILARDRGVKFRAAELATRPTTVTVKVTPVNLNTPEIFVRQFSSLLSPTDPNIYAVASVVDKDVGIHGELDALEIVDGDPTGMFQVTAGTKQNEYNIELVHPMTRDNSISQDYTITLRAKDKGTPPRSTTQVVNVRLAENTNTTPTFNQADYDVEIEEISPPGSRVLHLQASSSGNKPIVYKIESGNSNGTFSIHVKSGLLTLASSLDKEIKPYYSLTVSAYDPSSRGPKRKATAIVNVRVLDNNDNDPVFNKTIDSVVFDENKPSGSVVYTAYATDKDEDDNGYITYSLANLNPVPFTMDPFTGEIRATEVLDYETMRREYNLKVRASDWGAPFRRQAEMTVKVRLRDVNDHRPLFEKVGCKGYVSQSAPINTEIITLSAIDFDYGSSVKYRMVPSNDDSCFRLEPISGVLKIICDLAKLNIRERTINVSATDGTHFADVMSIHLKVISSGNNQRLADRGALMECRDVGVTDRYKKQLNLAQANNRNNDITEPTPTSFFGNKYSPEFPLGLPTEVWVNESLPVGSEVTSMKARDKDKGYSGLLVYVITSGDEFNFFRIDLQTGQLFVDAPLDREFISEYSLNISAFDLGNPQRSASRTLVVHVYDVNDNKPVFEKTSYNFVITESAKNGTSIVRLRATDIDEGVNSALTFHLETDVDEFHIDPQTGLLTVFGNLDRERTDTYHLKSRVTDGSLDNPLSSTTVVNIRVLDVNDNAPYFTLKQYWVKVREDLPLGVVVIVMAANDPDLDEGGQVTYSLTGSDTFTIDPLMGVVRLSKALDFETVQLYNVTITARDGGDPSLETQAALVVEVEDVNENMYPPTFEDVVVMGQVMENQPKGTLVTKVTAHDADPPGLNSQFSYSILDGDGMGFFSIDNQGNIYTSEILDRETSNRYWLTVHVVDRGAVPLSGRLDVYIEVLDDNDNVPLTTEPAYYPSIPENAPPGTMVLQLDAFDWDLNDDNKVRFSIASGDPQGYFRIDNVTGLITTAALRRLDREVQIEHALEIKIEDGGTPPLSSLTRVLVSIIDENDNDPEFHLSPYYCPVLEMPVANQNVVLCQVIASDADSGPSGEVTYSFVPDKGSDLFTVHPKAGSIFARQKLTAGEAYDFIVQATDQGSPPRSATIRVRMDVLPRSSSTSLPPVCKDVETNAAVAESDKVGQTVTFLQVEDPDGDNLWYSIVGGNSDGAFLIQPHSGTVSVARKLDWEKKSDYNLNISITDGVNIIYQQLPIKVIDVNDHSPVFLKNIYSADISENVPVGSTILQLEASDSDEIDENLFYSIYNSANPQSLKIFKIDSFSGKLSIARSLDHESIKKHMLTVMVRDNGTPSRRSFARVIIRVSDENDHHPEFSAATFECQVYETAALGSSVIRILAMDKDKGENSQLRFSIASGNIGNAFSIDPVLGLVLIDKQLNKQVMPEYFLLVRATDRGTPSLNSTVNVHIIITVANNAPPKFEQSDYIVELHENEKPGKPLIAIIATSRSSVYYEIISGNINDSFTINPTSGVLRTNAMLDFEVMKIYNLTVQATNMVGANSSTSVLVHVIDRNDNAPIFHQLEYRGQVIESDKVRSMVLVDSVKPLVVSAFDRDSEINSVLHYKIVEKSASAYFSIDPNTGAIKTASTFDHEKKSSFSFSVQAWDMGKPHLYAEVPAKVHISVIDINDCPPQFGESFYSAILLLPTYIGVHVINVIATDSDSYSTISYSITSGNIEKKFLINETTGDITVRDPEGLARKYSLTVAATDGEFTTTTKVVVKVQESQQSGLQFSEDKYYAKIQENSTEISTVAIITPLGTELNEHLTFHILNPSHMFKIGETTGVIKTSGRLFDREAQSFYTLVVEVRNEGREIAKYAHVLVEVSVVDINDNAPFFIGLPYFAVAPIDAAVGNSVFKIKAMDYDSGANGEIVFEIVDGDKRVFRIDKKTGEIFLKQSLGSTKYELTIQAKDKGNPALSSHVTLPIQVISHDMPVFAQQFYQVTVLENIPTRSPLLSVTASSPSGRQLIYSLVSGNRKEDLRLDFNTGVFYAVEDLDFETTPKYLLTLRATDAVSGIYSDAQVTIDVEDVNDNPPMFNQPSYNTSISEAAPPGMSVLQVRATDRDTKATQYIQYHIVGNTTSHFQIDVNDGTIYVKQPLDHEVKREHYFTVMATDGGHPLLNSTAHVWIGVADMNDNPPEFHQRHYKCTVNQEVKRGQFVTMVMASDPDESDQSRLKYTIIDGNELQSFSINPHTGIITMANLHQFNFEKSYVLNVSVTDDVHSSYASVYVSIQGANNHSPHFSHNVYPVALAENTPAGKLITTVSANDEDIGNYGQFTYTIESKEYRKFFRINSETGEVYTKVPIDREVYNLCQIIVSAVDAGGRCGYATVHVTITDENDNAPLFAVSEYTVTIPVNMTVGTTILKIHASDADEGVSSSLDYALYKSNNSVISELFGVTHDTGEVYVRKAAIGHENYGYQFFILVKDHGVPSLETVVPVNAIFIDPKEDYPKFEHFKYDFFIPENSPIGTIISFVNATCSRQVTYSFTPAPKGTNSELVLSKFSIDKQGSIMLMSEVDREVQSVYNLNVRATTVDLPTRVSCVDITIIVVDANDNDPEFESSVYSVSIAENIEAGATILKVAASDKDASDNGLLSYHFGTDADNIGNIFQLDSITGRLSTLVALDREETAFYNFSVIAYDHGEPRRFSTSWININLRDYNDNPPVFESQHYNGEVSEDAPIGTVVMRLTIEDRDKEKSNVDFYIIEGDLQGQFHITGTGKLAIQKSLDREVISEYQLTVLATDGKFTSKTWVSIIVSDVNDNPPICLKTKYTEMVSENIPLHTNILTVEATDIDSYKNSRLYFYLSGEDHHDFSIDPITGQLKTAHTIDREKRSRYLLKAHVQDEGRSDWECTSTVEVLVSDINDNAPEFAQELYSVNIPEDSEVGTLITKVHASDKDIGINRMINYFLVDSAHSHFSIDGTTGIVSLNKPVDREEIAMYNLTVQASDHGIPRLSTLCTLLVLLQDVNDNPPEFTSKFYHTSVPETVAVGTEILKLTATSRDSGVNAEIAYSIIQSPKSQVFSIHPKLGVLSVSLPLDYETAHGYFILVKAIDGGTPPLSSEVGVNITVTDANDNAPTFSQQSYNAIIREDALVGDKIIQVMASDIDSPPNARLKYSICGGDRFGQFIIDKDMGYLSLASDLDREKVSNYVIEICAEDSGVPTLSASSYVNIEVSDINDNPPLFSEENYTAIVQEGKPLGFTVLKFTVTDQDAPPNTGPFLFDILSGNEDSAFRVVQQDSTLRTASKFDVKNQSEFTLQVRVTDGGSPALYSDTWVNIIVIEESRYPPVVTPLDVSVSSYLDEFPGGVMGRVHAVDQDPYDKLLFDILSPHQNLFTIDREDGTINALPGLDVGSYELNVSISDGKFTTYTSVSIDVNMITKESVANSVALRLDDVTPEDFLLTYKKDFLRGLRNVLNVRMKDVEIISLQPTLQDKKRKQRATVQDLDIVFAVHAGANGFYPADTIRSKLKEKTGMLESSVGLKVVKIMEDRCTKDRCVNGECVDRIVLDKAFAISITTDAMSYVCPQHHRKLECACEPGFGGPQCELAVNDCSRRPCPSYRVCHPEDTVLGYICKCPEGKTGSLCDRDKGAHCKGPDCYDEKTPVSFQGKSYMSYVLNKPIDHHMSLVVQFRTKQATGNLLYASGVRDYFILEIINGQIQYRFDCGSGEGKLRIEQVKVNDGSWHRIRVERRGKSAEMILDKRLKASGKSHGSHEVLNLDGNDIYFGAEVRINLEVLSFEDIRMGFVGCMDDIQINGISLPLHVSGNTAVATLNRYKQMELHCGVLLDLGICSSQPCLNGGTCIPTKSGFACQCLSRYEGGQCEIDLDPCASNPCLNGGMCHNVDHRYICTCSSGISGNRCEFGRYCKPSPCHNGGVCEEGTFGPVCKCNGYDGELCQYDIDECKTVPCASGSCINLQGSFKCHCPPNMTGTLCNDHLFTTSITSSSWNTTIEEIVGISLVVILILLLAIAIVCCWRYRHKRQQMRPNNESIDAATNEYLLKNSVFEKDNLNRKISNLEVTSFTTPPLPPRPASYTPSTQDSVNALNNFDTVRSYGSAADDLENFPRQSPADYVQNISKPSGVIPALAPPSSSDNDSVLKGNWEKDHLKSKSKLYESKVPKDLQIRKVGDVPGLTIPAPVVPSRATEKKGARRNTGEGYIWDCSDWAVASQKPLSNIVEVSTKEVRDCSSNPSTESNSRASQIELLPKEPSNGQHRKQSSTHSSEDFDRSEYVGDSENNDTDFCDSIPPVPNFENILGMNDLEFADDGTDSLPASPHKYQRHPNSYLPAHATSTANTSPDHTWNGDQRQVCDLSDDEVMTYGFPPQGGRGFHVQVDPSGMDNMSMSVGGYTSTNASFSDISGAVCEIDDSEANCSDGDYEGVGAKPPVFSNERFCSTHL